MNKLKNNYLIIILLGISIITIIPFFHSGFFSFHDNTQVQRVFEMKNALLDGSFPVRWVKNLGYGLGYPIFNFYAPLPYYLGAFISFLGINALLATKIMIGFGILGSAFSMYFLAKEFWGKIGGFLSAVMYIFAPYHALDIYVRGAIGELYAYFFAPLIFFSLWKYYKSNNYSYIVLGSLSFCGLIISHNLTAMMLFPFIAVIAIILFSLQRKIMIFAIPVLGILISSFYFIPAILEMKYTDVLSTIGNTADFRDHFVCFRQLWDSPWLFGGSSPGCIDGLSFRLGKLHFMYSFIAIIFAFLFFKKDKMKSVIVLIAGLFLLISIILLLNQSKFIWEIVPIMSFFQYPWRFLLAASLFSSLISGSIIYYLSKFQTNKNKLLFYSFYIIIIVLPIILYAKLFVPQFYLNKTSEDYTNVKFIIWDTSKLSDEYLPPFFIQPKNQDEIILDKVAGENIIVKETIQKSNYFYSAVQANKDTKVIVHIPFFPAWQYYVNGKPTNIEKTNTGVSIILPAGDNRIEAYFVQTNIEKAANFISFSSILVLFVGIIKYRQKKSK